MVVSAAATPMDASAVAIDCHRITNTAISSNEPRSISNPIELFGIDYSTCNGTLAAMTLSIAATAPFLEPSSTKKHRAKLTQKKATPSTTRRKKDTPAAPASSPHSVLYAAAMFAASFVSSKTVVPLPRMTNPNARVTVVKSPLVGVLNTSTPKKIKGASTVMLGCVPKTEFHDFFPAKSLSGGTSHLNQKLESDLRGMRRQIMFHFNVPSCNKKDRPGRGNWPNPSIHR